MISSYWTCFWALGTIYPVVLASRLPGVPTIPWEASDVGGTYNISSIRSIIVDSKYADQVDETGETLIPPSLHDFRGVFAADMYELYGYQNITLPDSPAVESDSVFLTLSDTPRYQYVSGEVSAEGYRLEVSPLGITIQGASPLGVWWGTRSLLQLAILHDGQLPLGVSVDSPGWKVRGMMLDVARKYYPSQFVTDICSYMSFFKQNTLHLHLSDNLYNNVKIYSRERSLSLYARFRLWSDEPEVAGLNNYKNESYTKDDFKSLQLACAARGVTIIPEIEAPGHALPIVQWKPELGLSTDLSLLNISHPDAIPTMKTIWSTFFDWFDSKTVHIGADEYTGEVSEYNRFVNEMAEYIRQNGSKAVRIWGTFPPRPEYEDNISTNVSIQHWEFFEDNPLFDYIQNNYTVVNSDDTFYVVNKWSGSYPQKINITKTFHGNPETRGPWRPYIFDTKNSTNNPDPLNPAVLGSIAPLWNDYGPNASVVSETYYAWRDGLPALADKQWGGDLLTEEFVEIFPTLHSSLPHNFLEKPLLSSNTSVILLYDRTSWADPNHNQDDDGDDGDTWKIEDRSGNSYDALTNCTRTLNDTIAIIPQCTIDVGLLSKGRDYSLTMRLFISDFPKQQNPTTALDANVDADAVLFTGKSSTLLLTPEITLFADGISFRSNTTVPLSTWVDLSIIGRGERTFVSVVEIDGPDTTPLREAPDVRGRTEDEFLAILGVNGERFVWAPIAIEAPLTAVAGAGDNVNWRGEFAGLLLSERV